MKLVRRARFAVHLRNEFEWRYRNEKQWQKFAVLSKIGGMSNNVATPTDFTTEEISQVREAIKHHLDESGEEKTEFALRAEVPRDFLYRFLSESYKSVPSYAYVSQLVRALGGRINFSIPVRTQ
jgi:hypothetical protein